MYRLEVEQEESDLEELDLEESYPGLVSIQELQAFPKDTSQPKLEQEAMEDEEVLVLGAWYRVVSGPGA